MTNAIVSRLAVGFTSLGVLIGSLLFAPEVVNHQSQAQTNVGDRQILARSPIATVKINEKHIFEGEINRRGLAVGYHHRANGRDVRTARLVRVVSKANGQGVYVARVEIRNPSGQWVSKSANSSFFPDRWSRNQVLSEIRGAFANSSNPAAEPWQGTSPSGIRISGYYNRNTNTINTAYPIYRR